MASKEARIRLSLDSGDYIVKLQQVSSATEKVEKETKSAFGKSLSAGISSARSALGALGGELKMVLGQAVMFGGALGVASGVKGAIALQDEYKNIAYHLERATGEAHSWQDIQEDIESAADRTARTGDEMGKAFSLIFASTGDAKFAKEALDAVGQAATASGGDVEHMANIAQMLNRKFGATARELPDLMAAVMEKTDAGGFSMEQVTGSLDRLLGDAKRAGVQGSQGISLLLGTLAQLDGNMGADRAAIGLRQLFQQVKDGTPQMEAFQKVTRGTKLKIDADDDAFERVRKVLAGGDKVRKEFQMKFASPELRNVVDELSKPFDAAFEDAKKRGADTKEATSQGLRAFDEAMQKLGGSALTGAKLQKQAAERMNDPSRAFAKAMDMVKRAFAEPEMLDAVKDLASNLPALAKAIAGMVSFAAKNPLGAGAALVGGRIGVSFAGGMLGNAGSQLGGVATSAGLKLGGAASASIKRQIASGAIWANAGKAIGIAAAAYIAYEIGKHAVDNATKEERQNIKNRAFVLGEAQYVAEYSSSKTERQEYLKKAKSALKQSQSESPSVFSPDGAIGGWSLRASRVLNAATGGKMGMNAEEYAQTRDIRSNQEAKIRRVIADLEAGLSGGGKKAASAHAQVARAATNAAKSLDRLGAAGRGAGSHGLAPPGSTQSGSAPR